MTIPELLKEYMTTLGCSQSELAEASGITPAALSYYMSSQRIPKRENGSVALAEYQGRRDETGRAVGHAPKVLAEYCTMTEGEHQISIYAPPCIIREIPEEIRRDKRIVALSHEILMKGHPSVKDRILNKFRMFGFLMWNFISSFIWHYSEMQAGG